MEPAAPTQGRHPVRELRDGVRLPPEVRNRLVEAETPTKDLVVLRGQRLEARSWRNVELREARTAADGSVTVPLVGYSTTFGEPYEVFGGPDAGGWFETMSAGSWDKTISERTDIRLLENHEGAPLARTKSGTLRLSTDAVGVLNEADLDGGSPRIQSILSAVRRGDMDQMSCAFMVTRQDWSPDYMERRVLEVVGNDSSIVTFAANTNTLVLAPAQRAAYSTPVDPPADPTEPADGMTTCPSCGKPVSVDASQCPDCGASLGAERSVRHGMSLRMARALADQLRYARTG